MLTGLHRLWSQEGDLGLVQPWKLRKKRQVPHLTQSAGISNPLVSSRLTNRPPIVELAGRCHPDRSTGCTKHRLILSCSNQSRRDRATAVWMRTTCDRYRARREHFVRRMTTTSRARCTPPTGDALGGRVKDIDQA